MVLPVLGSTILSLSRGVSPSRSLAKGTALVAVTSTNSNCSVVSGY